jgi:hypothetical protein
MGEIHYEFIDKGRNKKKVIKKKKNSQMNSLLKQLKNSEESISYLLDKQASSTIVRHKEFQLRSLTRIKGTLLNSVVATNKKATTLVIKLDENDFFEDAEVRCHGLSFGKRVQGNCDLVVSEKEYEISGELWDLDGAEGVISDKFYDGSEKEFLTSGFASFFEGVLNSAKDKIITPYGESSKTNFRNTALGGLVGIANNANRKIKESSSKNIQIGLLNSGKRVFVFFQKGVSL